MTITVGTDTYVTEAEYRAYLAQSVRAMDLVSAQSSALVEAALVTATRRIEAQRYQGTKTGDPQTLSFPRTGMVDRYGDEIDGATVPANVKSADIELAFDITQDASLEQQSTANKNISSVRADTVSVSFFNAERANGRFPPEVQELLKEYLEAGGSLQAPYSPSSNDPDCQHSAFDPDPYGYVDAPVIIISIDERTCKHRILQAHGGKGVEVTELFELHSHQMVTEDGRLLEGFFIGQDAAAAKQKARNLCEKVEIVGQAVAAAAKRKK